MVLVEPRLSKRPSWVCCLIFLIIVLPSHLSLPNTLYAPLSKITTNILLLFKNSNLPLVQFKTFFCLYSPYFGGFLTFIPTLFLLTLSCPLSAIQCIILQNRSQICSCLTPPLSLPPQDKFLWIPTQSFSFYSGHSFYARQKNLTLQNLKTGSHHCYPWNTPTALYHI